MDSWSDAEDADAEDIEHVGLLLRHMTALLSGMSRALRCDNTLEEEQLILITEAEQGRTSDPLLTHIAQCSTFPTRVVETEVPHPMLMDEGGLIYGSCRIWL